MLTNTALRGNIAPRVPSALLPLLPEPALELLTSPPLCLSSQPTKVLGIYTFTKRVALEEMENKPRKQQGYSTVSHFNIVHYDCHLAAVRCACFPRAAPRPGAAGGGQLAGGPGLGGVGLPALKISFCPLRVGQ